MIYNNIVILENKCALNTSTNVAGNNFVRCLKAFASLQ